MLDSHPFLLHICLPNTLRDIILRYYTECSLTPQIVHCFLHSFKRPNKTNCSREKWVRSLWTEGMNLIFLLSRRWHSQRLLLVLKLALAGPGTHEVCLAQRQSSARPIKSLKEGKVRKRPRTAPSQPQEQLHSSLLPCPP